MGDARPAGWYPDPGRVRAWRYWSGSSWTPWLSDGTSVLLDEAVRDRPLVPGDAPHLDFVVQKLLPEARAAGVVTDAQAAGLGYFAGLLRGQATPPGPVPPMSTAPTPVRPISTPPRPSGSIPTPSAPIPWSPTPSIPTPTGGQAPTPTQPPQSRPRPAAAWSEAAPARLWRTGSRALRSDVAVHGLAYLGVLMLFVGAFGLVAFAFGDVAPRLRPLAEVAIAAAPFLAAGALLRRGATVAGRALEVAGGLLLPVILVTSLNDGVPWPPDLTDTALVVTLTGVCLILAGGYWTWVGRHPDSGLRFLVAPMIWLAVAMATTGVGRAVPSGPDVAQPSAAQAAAVAVAIAVTLLAAAARPTAALSEPSQTAGLVGVTVLAVLGPLTWWSEGWPVAAVVVAGVGLLVAMDALRGRTRAGVVLVGQSAWWSVVIGGLALTRPGALRAPGALAGLDDPAGVIGVIGVAGFVAVLERHVRLGSAGPGIWVPAAGLLVTQLWLVGAGPWWSVASCVGLASWAALRRRRPLPVPMDVLLDLVGAVAPVLGLVSLRLAVGGGARGEAWMSLAAAALVVLATVPATRPVLRRHATDRYWIVWWQVAVPAAALAVAWAVVESAWLGADVSALTAGAAALLALACAFGPLPARARPWVVVGLGAWAWTLACAAAGVEPSGRSAAMAAAGLLLVVAAHLIAAHLIGDGPTRWQPGHVGLTGHVLGLVAVVTTPEIGWALVAAVGFATSGWAVTSLFQARGSSPVGSLLQTWLSGLWVLPPIAALAGIPLTLMLALEQAVALHWDDPRLWLTCSATALGYALLARVWVGRSGAPAGGRPLRGRSGAGGSAVGRSVVVLGWASFAAAVVGVAGTAVGSSEASPIVPATLALAALAAAVVVLPGQLRAAPMRWTAWAVPAPLLSLVASQWWAWFATLEPEVQVSLSLSVVGATQVLAASAAEVRGTSWRPRTRLTRPALAPPLLVGVAELVIALAMTVLLSPQGAAAVTGLIAAGAVGAAGLLRLAPPAALGVVLAWVAVLERWWPWLDERPLATAVLVGLGLLVAARLHRVSPDGPAWNRWDVAVFVPAHVVAFSALVGASDGDQRVSTELVLGVLAWAVAGWGTRLPADSRRLWQVTYAVLGTCLVLAAAHEAGPAWQALGLGILAVALVVLAARVPGPQGALLHAAAVASVIAAWLSVVDWFDWSGGEGVDRGAVVAGVVAAGLGLLARTRPWARRGIAIWGAAAVAVTVALTVVSAWGQDAGTMPGSPWPGAGMLLACAGIALAARPLATPSLSAQALSCIAAAGAPFAVLSLLAGAGAIPAVTTIALSLVAVTASAGVLIRSAAAAPLTALGVSATVAGGLAAAVALPDLAGFVPVLLAAAALLAAVGVVRRSVALQAGAPLMVYAAWAILVREQLAGNDQLYLVPFGLALLCIVGLLRRDARSRGADPASTLIVILELAGLFLLVASSCVRTITDSPAFALVPVAVGILVGIVGVATRVRRRLAAGAAMILVGLVLLVAVPLVDLLPAMTAAAFWILVAVLGIGALLGATILERSRAVAHGTARRLAPLFSGWE